MPDTGPLDECRPIARRWLRAHRLGRRQPCRAQYRGPHASRCRDGTDHDCQYQCRFVEKEIQRGEAVKGVVHLDQAMTEQHTADRAKYCSRCHHRKCKFEVMHDDLPIAEAKRFQDGDLLALQGQ